MTVDVKKQGNVWTIYLDESDRPMPIETFETTPMGFPFTGKDQILARYPGAKFRFVEKYYPPQPESVFTPEMEKELSKMTTKKDEPAPAPAAPVSVGRDALSDKSSLATYVDKITTLFSEYLRTNDPDLEAVGTFLITAIPELEPILKDLAVAKPREKRKFSL